MEEQSREFGNMVQIPIEEYKKYIEFTLKGPTVELTLKEYTSLKEKIDIGEHTINTLTAENAELRAQNKQSADVLKAMEGMEKHVIKRIEDAEQSILSWSRDIYTKKKQRYENIADEIENIAAETDCPLYKGDEVVDMYVKLSDMRKVVEKYAPTDAAI